MREPAELQNMDGQKVGQVTSGLLSPTLNQPIAMGYVRPEYSIEGTELFAIVRGKPVPMVVAVSVVGHMAAVGAAFGLERQIGRHHGHVHAA